MNKKKRPQIKVCKLKADFVGTHVYNKNSATLAQVIALKAFLLGLRHRDLKNCTEEKFADFHHKVELVSHNDSLAIVKLHAFLASISYGLLTNKKGDVLIK